MSHGHRTDNRIRKTHMRLHGALASLVHEKPFDDIVVREVLARAGVGRSTFYAHYRDKDDLLDRGIRDILRLDARPSERWTCATDRVLRFSLPFLEHVERWRENGRLPTDAGAAATIHEHLRRVLGADLTDELRAERRRVGTRVEGMAAELLARHIAATFVLCLDWWLEHPASSARDVDHHFRTLVAPTLRATLAG